MSSCAKGNVCRYQLARTLPDMNIQAACLIVEAGNYKGFTMVY